MFYFFPGSLRGRRCFVKRLPLSAPMDHLRNVELLPWSGTAINGPTLTSGVGRPQSQM